MDLEWEGLGGQRGGFEQEESCNTARNDIVLAMTLALAVALLADTLALILAGAGGRSGENASNVDNGVPGSGGVQLRFKMGARVVDYYVRRK